MKKLYLIDGMSLVFRAYHAMFRSGLSTPDGEPSGAVFGFTNIITSLLEREKPNYIAIAFDRREETFRHKRYPEYKANRDEFPEDLVPQLERIKKLLDLMKIQRLEEPGFEADDIIGTLAREAEQKDVEVICVTSDKDFYQLVDERVKLLKPATKGGDFETISYQGVADKFGVKPEQVIDVLALIGDSSDNIPGVKGIGIKTAVPLIKEYGSLEGVYDNIDKIKGAAKKKLEENKEMAFLSKELVTIMREMDIKLKADDFFWEGPDYAAMDEFFAKEGFNQIRKRWQEKAKEIMSGKEFEKMKESAKEKADAHYGIENINDTDHKYIFVDSPEKYGKMISELEETQLLSFDLETSSLDRQKCEIVGIALAAEENKAYYIPMDVWDKEEYSPAVETDPDEGTLFKGADRAAQKESIDREPLGLNPKMVLNRLKPILESPYNGKCGQNCKFDSFILKRFGIDVSPVVFDSMIASYLLDPESRHDLKTISNKYLSYEPVPISKLIGEKKSTQISMRDVNPEKISDYACEDADLALKLRNVLHNKLDKENMLKLAEDIEFPLVEVLTNMEYNGVAIDEKALSELSKKISKQAEELTHRIYDEAGTEFNIDSTKQLGHVLFEKMMLPAIRKTKTGYSTDVRVLTELSETYPIANMILEYRSLVKLRSTYIDALPKLVNPLTGRIHTSYNQTVTSTGRLSSTDPNLQNIPIRSELGKEVRRAFVPQDKESIIFSADYSQVELRIMAYICDDKTLVDGFKEGLDIHSSTAAKLYNKPLDEVTADMRRIAKTVNFGIMYGLGAFGLSQRLNIPRSDAAEIIDNYFEKYPGIRKYIDQTIEDARKKGYAETLKGRKRYFPDINSKNRNLRTAAERGAINMPIQGTAADMMKIAMVDIDRRMREEGLKSLMMLQVHDELVFEARPDELEKLKQLVIESMEAALPLGDVPVVVDTGTGDNWFEAH